MVERSLFIKLPQRNYSSGLEWLDVYTITMSTTRELNRDYKALPSDYRNVGSKATR